MRDPNWVSLSAALGLADSTRYAIGLDTSSHPRAGRLRSGVFLLRGLVDHGGLERDYARTAPVSTYLFSDPQHHPER